MTEVVLSPVGAAAGGDPAVAGPVPGFVRQTLGLVAVAPLPVPGPAALAGRLVHVFNGTPALREQVGRTVRACGGRTADEPDPDVDVLVDLTLCGDPEADWREPVRRTVTALHRVYDRWAAETQVGRRQFVAVTALGGTLGLTAPHEADRRFTNPLTGIWSGLCKTLPRELPACRSRVVDLGPDVDPGPAVLAELLAGELQEVGVRAGTRRAVLPRAEPVDGPPVDLGVDDVLLMTGGARGIGFEIALDMARRTGCRVVVSGRRPLPADDSCWLTADDDGFAALGRTAYLERGGRSLPAVRREVELMRQAREIRHNLRRAAGVGARIEYAVCDVTRAEEVAALVATAGPGLSVVVHNAGIDQPTRLSRKTPDDVVDVIAVKVDGFRNLVGALAGRPLKVLCAVGSLTGRYGGMVGQVDYAAANEGLARLVMWVGHHRGDPVVKSLSWPTWDGLGLITNLEAASRYMRPIPVAAGVRAWAAELTHGGCGEVGFVAEIGEMTPQQLAGITVPSDWADRVPLLTRRFLLGDVVEFTPHRLLTTRHRIDGGWAQLLADTRFDGAAAVPVSVLLEYLLDGARWLTPPMGPLVSPTTADRIWVRPGALRSTGLVRRARGGGPVGGPADWRVCVELEQDGQVVARGEFGFGPVDAATPASPDPTPPGPVDVTAAGPTLLPRRYAWLPYLTGVGPWRRTDAGWSAEVEPVRPVDLFVSTEPPRPVLPLAHLEALVAVAPGTPDEVWTADALSLHATGEASRAELGDGLARVVDRRGTTLLSLRRPRWVRG
ncbi:SDR family NAD(P)-dependent oxidoreductase [Micromonospora wenchangensis]|uniref:Ketoreductase domain-containing protein n=1 Tax=Micromonospora wenchangensis TaxID=1185415 RepID=A0A246RNR7_9ACTN|nr:SDR family NAD(P)-dependent oxidoreductase [Micromonospora wenchangensis]OWV08706.1 hypothetical protein B5D80_11445 [Micromonospora wenchangensis]